MPIWLTAYLSFLGTVAFGMAVALAIGFAEHVYGVVGVVAAFCALLFVAAPFAFYVMLRVEP